ncbi:MbtH family NRPS accessory protein [Streptomyces kaniharaensis]|uniref:MbtH family NRPS accessory protein n=1 Tax=Streptomyces kaniharaensis TaxID=212423 RepID=A0A6N7KTH1_9ACTN|nr:MbtH family NRPS accessory protein [Streptomyces kaniharaensis]MQS14932.1 MbtH family NRPS accessory protein [Streptomyces kaniharaensis]
MSAVDTAAGQDARTWAVVLNDEEQYSVWPADRQPPAGWTAVGAQGTREECLAHIATVWTDLRPLSLRRRMAA